MGNRSVGIDLGVKTTHEVAVMEPGAEKPLARFRCGHTRADLEALLQRAQVGMEPGAELCFVMEPTGTVWMPVAAFLQAQVHPVYLVKAEIVSDQRKVLKKHVKNDQLDAITQAKLPWIVPTALNQLFPVEPRVETLRRRVKQAYKLSLGQVKRQQRIEALVRLALPVSSDIDLFSKAGQTLCLGYLNPPKVKRLGISRLIRIIQRTAGVKAGAEAAYTWYQACIEALKLYSDQEPIFYDDLQSECRMEFEALVLERAHLRQVEARIHELYVQLHPSRHLETIRGVGPYMAAASIAALLNPNRFPNPRKFRAYTGMVPRVSGTGQKESKGKPISKVGPNWYKRALFLAAESARRWDPQLAKIYYDQIVKYGRHHRHAVCVVATHLADRIFQVYRQDRPYELRDLNGNPISTAEANRYIQTQLTVPEEVRQRIRARNKGKYRLATSEPANKAAQSRRTSPLRP